MEADTEARYEALERSEKRFRTLASHAPVGLFLTDARGQCLFENDRWRALTGLTLAEAAGEGWAGALHPDDRERVVAEWYATAGREFASEYRYQTPAGKVSWVIGSAAAVRDDEGEVIEYLGTVSDITERKLAEEELRRKQDELSDFVENASVALHWVGPEGTILWANRAELELLGYIREEYIGHNIAEFHVDAPVIEDILQRLTRKEELHSYEARLCCKAG
jgi:PAS domain S-box-containing protein